MSRFGERLALLRAKAGLSRVQLARAAGLDRSTVYRLEAGRSDPCMLTVASLAEALGTTIAELLSYSRRKR